MVKEFFIAPYGTLECLEIDALTSMNASSYMLDVNYSNIQTFAITVYIG